MLHFLRLYNLYIYLIIQDLIYQEIEFIVEDFEGGKDIGKIKTGYRQFRVKSHLIIYKKAEDGIVEIVRVLHQMMDIPHQL